MESAQPETIDLAFFKLSGDALQIALDREIVWRVHPSEVALELRMALYAALFDLNPSDISREMSCMRANGIRGSAGAHTQDHFRR